MNFTWLNVSPMWDTQFENFPTAFLTRPGWMAGLLKAITTQSNIFWFTGAVVCHYALSSIHFLGILMNMAPFFPFEFIRVKLKPSIQGSFSHWGTSQKLFDLIGGLPDAAKTVVCKDTLTIQY